MAQAQLDQHRQETNTFMHCDGFQSIHFSPSQREIYCQMSDDLKVIIKKTRREPVVILEKGSKRIRLRSELFDTLCEVKVAVLLLKSYLEGNPEVVVHPPTAANSQKPQSDTVTDHEFRN